MFFNNSKHKTLGLINGYLLIDSAYFLERERERERELNIHVRVVY